MEAYEFSRERDIDEVLVPLPFQKRGEEFKSQGTELF